MATLAVTRAVTRVATTGDADLVPVRSRGPSRHLSVIGEIEVVLMWRPDIEGVDRVGGGDNVKVRLFEECVRAEGCGGRTGEAFCEKVRALRDSD